MHEFGRDPVTNAIQNGILRDIRVLMARNCLRGALILIYAGIDAMAYLSMPPGQVEVTAADFVRWVDEYIRFPCEEQVTGADLYGARCALVHTYTPESRSVRQGRCRQLGYMSEAYPEVIYNPSELPGHVLVSVPGLAEAFILGVITYLSRALEDQSIASILRERMASFVLVMPVNPSADGGEHLEG
jgi:hypothetical protein